MRKYFQGLGDRNNLRARANRVLHDVLKKFRRAAKGSVIFSDIVCCKNEPTTGSPVFVDDILDRLDIVAGLFQKISGQLIEIYLPDIEPLAAASAGHEIFRCTGLGFRLGQANWIGKSPEVDIRKVSMKGLAVVYERLLEHFCWSPPRIAVGKSVASQFVSLVEQGRQVVNGEYFAAWRQLIYQAKRCVIRSCNSKPIQYGSARVNCGSWKVVKRK